MTDDDKINSLMNKNEPRIVPDIEKMRAEFDAEKEAALKKVEAEINERVRQINAETNRIRAAVTRDLDLAKADAEKKITELDTLLAQSRRENKEKEDQIKLLESSLKKLEDEVFKTQQEKHELETQNEAIKAENLMIISSREALESEIAALRRRYLKP